MNMPMELYQEALTLEPWLKEIRRGLHRHPELGGQESWTRAYLMERLKEIGADSIETYPGMMGLTVQLKGGHPGGCVALRADMDGLPIQERTGEGFSSEIPGRMHACGHDAHMAIALGAARLLSLRRNAIHGTVKLLFEPAEETEGGGKRMVAAGCLENPKVKAVLGLHMTPDYPAGTVYTRSGCVSGASDDLRLEFTGKGCHGAYPERGVDAIVIAAQAISALQTLVSRNTSPVDSAVLSLGKIAGGTASNVICGHVTVEGTLRTLRPETRETLKKRIRETAEGIAKALGGECRVQIRDSYGSVYNDPKLHRAAVELMSRMNVQLVCRPVASLGVESFSFFIQNTPGYYYDLGCGPSTALHTDTFTVDEACLPLGAAIQAGMALEQLKEENE